MKSLLLKDDDITLDDMNNLAITEGSACMLQDVCCAVTVWLGEDIFHTEDGVPFKQEILGQAINEQLIRDYLRREALKVPGVEDITVANIEKLDNRTLKPEITVIGEPAA